MKKILTIDFDGVIHYYRKGWQGGKIYDEPVPGAIEWLKKITLNNNYEANIYSARSKDPELLEDMKDWLRARLDQAHMNALKFPTQKPAAWLTIDDRTICFRGFFPSDEQIDNFKPWNK